MMPALSPETLNVVRALYGVLLLGTLLYTLPQARRFFVSERWRGYAESSPSVDALQNPISLVVLQIVWAASAVALIAGWQAPWAAAVNVVLCRYFFIAMRWQTVHRGMGAPGFTTYWLGLVVFGLTFADAYASELLPLVLLVAQVDFAFLYLSSGIYKFRAGYLQGEGMDLGMVNPQWGYWWRTFRRIRPTHAVFAVSNQAAWALEIVAVVLMLVPGLRFWGGLLLIASFLYVAAFIRLGLLAEAVMLVGVLYFEAGSLGDAWLAPLGAWLPSATALPLTVPEPATEVASVLLWAYLALLPLAYAGLHYNFYLKRTLAAPLQTALERYTNFFGMIIWRVFSADLVNFCIRVYEQRGHERRELTRYGWRTGGIRFSHVGESITLTCLFTTLKYYPSNSEIFRRRLLRYARSHRIEPGSLLVFLYLRVTKIASGFDLVPAAEFTVDPINGTIAEKTLDSSFSIRAAADVSPVHEGARPGSYAPLGS